MHINTKAFLHSHLHQAPLSQQQEVSAYAEKNGGDDWEVVCVDKSGDGKQWMRDAQVRLKHRETEHYLSTSKSYAYRYDAGAMEEWN
jgi:dolichyl-phosphate-mannose--protein O-mannosyl transferase